MHWRRITMWFAVLSILALIVAACPADDDGVVDEPPEPDPVEDEEEAEAPPEDPIAVTYGTPTTLRGPGQAPFASLPVALGYWEEEGLDVDVQGFNAAGEVVAAVDAGHLDIGLGGSGSFIPGVAAGADLVAFYTERTLNFQRPMVPVESGIETIADLAGTTIGVVSLESSAVPLITAMVDRVGEDPDTIDFVAIGAGPDALEQLRAGRVDVLGLWDSAHAGLEALDEDLELRYVSDEFFDDLGFVQPLFARSAMLEENRDVLVRFARGMAKATLFATENPEAAVRLHWDMHPDSRPTGVPEDEALEGAVLVLSTHLERAQPIEGLWGFSTREQIEAQLETLQRGGVLAEEVDIDDFWTDELIDDINDFDQDAVREQARNWTP